MAPIFLTIGDVDGLYRQFLDFILYMYVAEKVKPQLKKTIQGKAFFTNAMRTMNTSSYPKTLEELTELYLQEPITEQDRNEFLSSYILPFMSTGKSVKELYSINPERMTPVLDALIQSKRIQRLISENQGDILNSVKRQFEVNRFYGASPPKKEEFLNEIQRLLVKYQKVYEDQEAVIASRWVEAMEKEPRFLASNTQYSNTVQESKKGGKRYRRKTRKSGRKTRRTRK